MASGRFYRTGKLTEMITLAQFKFAFGWILLVLAALMLWQTTPGYLAKNCEEPVISQRIQETRAEESAKGQKIKIIRRGINYESGILGSRNLKLTWWSVVSVVSHRHHVVDVRLRWRTLHGAADDRGPAFAMSSGGRKFTLGHLFQHFGQFDAPLPVREL